MKNNIKKYTYKVCISYLSLVYLGTVFISLARKAKKDKEFRIKFFKSVFNLVLNIVIPLLIKHIIKEFIMFIIF